MVARHARDLDSIGDDVAALKRDLSDEADQLYTSRKHKGPAVSGRALSNWWSHGGSNPGPPQCHCGALPAEL